MTTDAAARETKIAPELMTCRECGRDGLKGDRGVLAHWRLQCSKNPKREERDAKRDMASHVKSGAVSKRGRSRRGFGSGLPSAIEQIRPRPGGLLGGPAAYFLNPQGATIREVVLIRPNGAPVMRGGRDVANAQDVQRRMRERGYEYIGPTLTTTAARRLVEVLELNRFDYTLDLTEQIADCDHAIDNSDRPEARDIQRRRKTQLTMLLEQARVPLDADRLVSDLDDIVKAHKLAALNPAIREAIASMVETETDSKVSALVEQLTGGKRVSGEEGFAVSVSNVSESDDF